jgi:uncharacterized protein (UPF0261 family)
MRGFSQLNIEGGPLYEPGSDAGFTDGLIEALSKTGASQVKVVRIDSHINSPVFAESVAKTLSALIESCQTKH